MIKLICRYVNGPWHYARFFSSLEEAREYLRSIAEECYPTHRRVIFDEEEAFLLLEYSGDDTVVFFAVQDEEDDGNEGDEGEDEYVLA